MKMLNNFRPFYFIIPLGVIFLVACSGSKSATPHPSATKEPLEQTYPMPESVPLSPQTTLTRQPAYPQPEPPIGEPYPLPFLKPTTPVDIVPFRINRPVIAGATEVTGEGPSELPILIADVTFMGELLGEGKIEADGTFIVKLNMPLEKDHRIGIALGNLRDTPWEFNDFSNRGYFGEEFRQVPTVGFFYDTAAVTAK